MGDKGLESLERLARTIPSQLISPWSLFFFLFSFSLFSLGCHGRRAEKKVHPVRDKLRANLGRKRATATSIWYLVLIGGITSSQGHWGIAPVHMYRCGGEEDARGIDTMTL